MANRFLSNISINDAYTFPASDGSFGQAIVTDGAGNLSFGDVASGGSSAASVIFKDNFTGDGVETEFSMARGVTNEDQTQIYIDGAYQEKGTYTVSGNLITFSTAPTSGHSIEVMTISGINTGPTTLYQDNFTGNGATTNFTLANSVDNEIKTMVFLNGVYQFKGTYSTSGTTLSFDTAPGNGTLIEVITIASAASPSEAQRVLFYGKASGAISKGDAVMFTGAEGDHFLFAKATQAAIAANHEYFIGLADQDFSNNEFGYVVEFGNITNIDTTVYTSTAGTTLWFDSGGSTAGAITETEPAAPNVKIQVAAVIRLHASVGSLFVRPLWYHELSQLHDVNITSAADKDLLVWDAANGYWENSKTVDTLTATTLSATTLTGTLSTAAQTNITSVGTLSSLAVSGDLTVDTNTLFVDASGNNVGIGTTSIKGKLHSYQGDSGQSAVNINANGLVIEDNASNGISILTPSSNEGNIFFGDESDNFVGGIRYYHSTNDLAFEANNAERMRIKSNGDVGIGESSPIRPLHVNGGTDNIIALFESTDATSAIEIKDDTGSSSIYSVGGVMRIDGSTGTQTLRLNDNATLEITENNIVGGVTLRLNNTHSAADWGAGSKIGVIDFYSEDTSVAEKVYGAIELEQSSVAATYPSVTDFVFKARNINLSEIMRISGDGSVGIGTSSPALTPLHIHNASGAAYLHITNGTVGDTATDGTSIIQDTDGDFLIRNRENANTLFYTNNLERLRIDANGNVIVGSTTANNGNAATFRQDGTAYVNNVQLANAAGSVGGTTPSIYSPAGGQLAISLNSGERLRIDGSGNVGIGTSSPLTLLHAAQTVSAGNIVNAALFSQNSGSNPTVGQGVRIVLAANNNLGRSAAIEGAHESGTNAHRLSFLTSANGADPTERMRIDSSGNVSIGLVSGDVAQLKVKSTASAKAALFLDSSAITEDTYTTYAVGSSNGWEVGMKGSGSSYGYVFSYGDIGTASNERMRITSAGAVLPGADDTYSLGDGTNRWRYLYNKRGVIYDDNGNYSGGVRQLVVRADNIIPSIANQVQIASALGISNRIHIVGGFTDTSQTSGPGTAFNAYGTTPASGTNNLGDFNGIRLVGSTANGGSLFLYRYSGSGAIDATVTITIHL